MSPKFDTRKDAEHALAEWVAQSQEHMEMDGCEDDQSDQLLPDAPSDMSGSSYKNVMGGQKQDFRAPRIGGGNFKESSEYFSSDTPSLMEMAENDRSVQDLQAYMHRESVCPACDGARCGYCDQTGAVTRETAKQLREAIRAKGNSYGNNLLWHDSDKIGHFHGNHTPTRGTDPASQAWNTVAQYRARR